MADLKPTETRRLDQTDLFRPHPTPLPEGRGSCAQASGGFLLLSSLQKNSLGKETLSSNHLSFCLSMTPSRLGKRAGVRGRRTMSKSACNLPKAFAPLCQLALTSPPQGGRRVQVSRFQSDLQALRRRVSRVLSDSPLLLSLSPRLSPPLRGRCPRMGAEGGKTSQHRERRADV
ncbi:hypothetical protein SAMN05444272_0994 [Roseibium suaedae]|uniref:Uncharacterized protein n=1 Tax=Roseibium suaedae TaxID=735517 RepID=A0A1M7BVU1_9HYPH|nr:hypothetical protein SAMN05444272_0994 [Roseibium suaedae]